MCITLYTYIHTYIFILIYVIIYNIYNIAIIFTVGLHCFLMRYSASQANNLSCISAGLLDDSIFYHVDNHFFFNLLDKCRFIIIIMNVPKFILVRTNLSCLTPWLTDLQGKLPSQRGFTIWTLVQIAKIMAISTLITWSMLWFGLDCPPKAPVWKVESLTQTIFRGSAPGKWLDHEGPDFMGLQLMMSLGNGWRQLQEVGPLRGSRSLGVCPGGTFLFPDPLFSLSSLCLQISTKWVALPHHTLPPQCSLRQRPRNNGARQVWP